MYLELGIQPSAVAVAAQYRHLIQGFVMDSVDSGLEAEVRNLGMHTQLTQTLMGTLRDRRRLARDVLDFMQAT